MSTSTPETRLPDLERLIATAKTHREKETLHREKAQDIEAQVRKIRGKQLREGGLL